MTRDAHLSNRENSVRAFVDPRRHVRYATKVPCRIQPFTGVRLQSPVRAKILNLSPGGALVELPLPLKINDHLYLIVGKRNLKISAVVVSWTQHGYHLKFMKELDPQITEEIAFNRL